MKESEIFFDVKSGHGHLFNVFDDHDKGVLGFVVADTDKGAVLKET
jgi:hypothetical protein